MTALDDLLESELAGAIFEIDREVLGSLDESSPAAITLVVRDASGRALTAQAVVHADGSGASLHVRGFGPDGEPAGTTLIALPDGFTLSL